MKIAWFSPFPPQKSGISDYSENIVYELKKRCEVHLWTHGPVNESIREDFPVTNYVEDPASFEKLKEYSGIVYNMGNNITYHEEIYNALKRHPGIVVLHEYVLNGFFMNYLSKARYVGALLSRYGLRGLAWYAWNSFRYRLFHTVLRHIYDQRPFSFHNEMEFPFVEEVLKYAKGVVVHSDYIRKMLLGGNISVAVAKINLPYYVDRVEGTGDVGKDVSKVEKDKFIILSLGEATPYKQLDKVILALAEDEVLRGNCIFYIIGQPFDERIDLAELIQQHGLEDSVKMLGYLPIEKVYGYLSQAGAYIGIRYPTMGETSSGLIRAMEQGSPCIVTDIGWYSELPDDCVAKIGAPVDVEELRGVLRRLMEDRGYSEALGRNARKHIHEEYSTELYGEKLLNFIEALS